MIVWKFTGRSMRDNYREYRLMVPGGEVGFELSYWGIDRMKFTCRKIFLPPEKFAAAMDTAGTWRRIWPLESA